MPTNLSFYIGRYKPVWATHSLLQVSASFSIPRKRSFVYFSSTPAIYGQVKATLSAS